MVLTTVKQAPVSAPTRRLVYVSMMMKAKDLVEAVKDFKFQHYKVNASN